jgi:H+-transporting ATPase
MLGWTYHVAPRTPFADQPHLTHSAPALSCPAAVLGCTYYVVAAWIWSLIWHMGLDPLKWIMMYMMDDEGFRSRGGGMFSNIFRMHGENIGAGLNLGINKMSMARVSAARMSMNRASMGRVSAGGYQTGGIPGVGGRMVPNAAMLQRASLVKVH